MKPGLHRCTRPRGSGQANRASRLRWRKDGDSAFLDPRGGKGAGRAVLPGPGEPTKAKVWPAGRGGIDQVGYVLQSFARILEADAVEGDDK